MPFFLQWDPSAVDVVVASTESTLPILLPLLTKIVSPSCKITATSSPQVGRYPTRLVCEFGE